MQIPGDQCDQEFRINPAALRKMKMQVNMVPKKKCVEDTDEDVVSKTMSVVSRT